MRSKPFVSLCKSFWLQIGSASSNVQPSGERRTAELATSVWSSRPSNLLQRLCKKGLLDEALDFLHRKCTVPPVHVYASLFRLCARKRALDHAKQVHLHLTEHGLENTQYLGESVVKTLVKCGGLDDALQAFCRLSKRTACSWTALISGYTAAGQCHKALRMYECMLEEGLEPTKFTFVSLLKACSALFDLQKGRRIHGDVLRYGYSADIFVSTCLMNMYARCGSVVDAKMVFDALPQRDVVAWTAIISAYIQRGEPLKALQLYEQMQTERVSPDGLVFVSALQACGMLAEKAGNSSAYRGETKTWLLQTGRAIHEEAWNRGFQSDLFVANTLMKTYGNCGSTVDASNVFHGLTNRDAASWNVMILVYAQEGQPDRALQLYEQMLQEGNCPDAYTFVRALQSCCKLHETSVNSGLWSSPTPLEWGRRIHFEAWDRGYKSDVVVGSSLVVMYSTCGSIIDARSIFDSWVQKDVVTWNAMLAAYAQSGQAEKVFDLYNLMQEEGLSPDSRTFVSILQACGTHAEIEDDCMMLDERPIKVASLALGKETHAAARKRGHLSNAFVGNTLISLYGKCGSVADAWNVFAGMHERDRLSWNAMLLAHFEQGQPEEILRLYKAMLVAGVSPDSRTYVCALQACVMLAGQGEEDGAVVERSMTTEVLGKGKAIHAHARRYCHKSDIFVCNALINMYGKCRSIEDAERVFKESPQQEVVSWNNMLAAYVHHGNSKKFVHLYEEMLEDGPTPNDWTIVSAVEVCGMLAEPIIEINGQLIKPKSLVIGKALQFVAWTFGFQHDMFVGNSLLNMYVKCGSILDAEIVLHGAMEEYVKSWNTMMLAHLNQGQSNKVWQLHEQLLEHGVKPDAQTLVNMLHACSFIAEQEKVALIEGQLISVNALHRVKTVHAAAWTGCYGFVSCACDLLVSTLGKCGSILDAQNVFDGLSEKNISSWNAMLTSYAHHGHAGKTLEIYKQMLKELISPNVGTFVSMLQAYGTQRKKEDDVAVDGVPMLVQQLGEAKALHAEIWRMGFAQDRVIGNSLISMYGRLESITDARAVFDELSKSSVVSWNLLLVAYTSQCQVEKVHELYVQMLHEGVSPDDRTYVSLLRACCTFAESEEVAISDDQSLKMRSLDKGKAIHAAAWLSGYKLNMFVSNTLIHMYGKCGSHLDAQSVFDGLHQRSVVSWNALLAAFAHQGQEQKVLKLYEQMLGEGLSPDEITLSSLLQVFSKIGSLDLCRQLHDSFTSTKKQLSPLLASTLIHAYGRCANMVEAQTAFNLISQPDVVSWNALSAGYARQGDWEAVLRCYKEMQMGHVKPNGVTFLSLLSACSHAGLVDLGVTLFFHMFKHHSVFPETEHYACMIDLLGRAGHFSMIEELLATMPTQPNLSTWLCLLAACRKHGEVCLGEHAFRHAIRLHPDHCASYLLMSNIYAQAGMWDRASEINELRIRAGAFRNPGHSWVKHEQQIYSCVVGVNNQHVHNLIQCIASAMKESYVFTSA